MKHTFDCDDSLVDKVLALCGRIPKAEVYRNALKCYYEILTKTGYSPDMLPNPKFFEKKLRELSPAQIEHYRTETSRLYNIATLHYNNNKALEKKRKELLK